jgi:hypothetical protein
MAVAFTLIGTLILAAIPQVRDHIWPGLPKWVLLATTVISVSAILVLLRIVRRSRRKLGEFQLAYNNLSGESNDSKANTTLLETQSSTFQTQLGVKAQENEELKHRIAQLEEHISQQETTHTFDLDEIEVNLLQLIANPNIDPYAQEFALSLQLHLQVTKYHLQN